MTFFSKANKIIFLITSASSSTQIQNLQTQRAENQTKLVQFQQQLQEQQEQLNQQHQAINQSQKEVQEKEQQISEVNQQVQSAQQSQAEQPLQSEIARQQAQATQAQQAILQQEWEEIQELQEEVLEEEPAPPLPQVNKAIEAATQAAEAAADSSSENSSAQEKQMTYLMLFLIIFLMEYIVYKRNGLPGLVVLNICLAIAYYHKDTLKEYVDLWDKYVLIMGYVMGNVLAYSAPEQEKYKLPNVAGFNAIIALIYGYTWYQKRQITQQTQKEIEKIHQEAQEEISEQSQAYEAETKKQEKEYIQQQKQTLTKLNQRPQPQPQQKELEEELEQIQETIEDIPADNQQKQIAQERIEEIQQTLQEIKKTSLTSAVDIDLLEQKEPGIKSEWQRIKNWLKSVIPKGQTTDNLSRISEIISSLPLTEEEIQILNSLHLNSEQILAISSQAERVKYHQAELKENYSQLTQLQKLKLLNVGLENLGLKTLESKANLAQLRQQIFYETQSFDLTVKEKENILRLLITNLNLSTEQRNALENMGVSFFDASNWQVSDEQKNQLLSYGLAKVNLNEKQQEILTDLHSDRLKTFAFTEQQKIILFHVS